MQTQNDWPNDVMDLINKPTKPQEQSSTDATTTQETPRVEHVSSVPPGPKSWETTSESEHKIHSAGDPHHHDLL